MVAAVIESPVENGSRMLEEPVELSVVLPCLNEARTVGRCVQKSLAAMKKMGVRGEVIVADNGSSDGSIDIARSHGARVVQVERKGYGSALQGGIAAANGKFVIMGDADDSYDFTRLEGFVERLRQGDELVMGNRFKGGIHPGAMPWSHRYVGNPVLSGILNLFFHTPIGDAHCGLRGFRKDSYERLRLSTTGMEFASEMVVKASLNKQKISEVPTELHPDGRDRPPHLRSFRDGWRHLRFLLLLCPLWLYLIPAAILFGGGLAIMAWLTAGPREVAGITLGMETMLTGAFAVVIGYQAMWLWLFAKIHGHNTGLFPSDRFSDRVARHFSVEKGSVIGLGLLVLGAGLAFWLALNSSDVSETVRIGLWTLVALSVGVQTIFGSFFIGMLGMKGKIAD